MMIKSHVSDSVTRVDVVLRFDPEWVDVPLVHGLSCRVMAHQWRLEGDDVVFSLELVDRSALDVVWLPRVVVRDIDWMTVVHPVHQKSEDTPATIFRYISDEFPEPEWEIGTIVGGIVRILCFGFSGEGDDLAFSHFVPRQGDSRPYIIPALRFPKKLFVDEYATWW